MDKQERFFRLFLQSRGLRFTPERRDILHSILSIGGHFDVEELHTWMQNNGHKLSLATIYRAMPLFIESNLITASLRQEGRTHYESTSGNGHHDHLICLGCGKIIEFKDDEIEVLQEKVCKQYGFLAIEHSLGIKGYCKECRSD